MRTACILLLPAACALITASCGGSDASRAVERFADALADSSYDEAWQLVTPSSRQLYDSTVVILHHFGYAEALTPLTELAGEMTEEEFQALDGRRLFSLMVARSETAHALSTSIRSVTYRDSTLAVVVVRTGEGPQEVPVRLVEGAWLVDLTGLAPPAAEGEQHAGRD